MAKKYYEIISYTLNLGEEFIDYVEVESEDELYDLADKLSRRYGEEHYQDIFLEKYDITKEEYLDVCGYIIKKIDYESFQKAVNKEV